MRAYGVKWGEQHYTHVASGNVVRATTALSWLWVILLGPTIYFAAKGVWTHAAVSAILASPILVLPIPAGAVLMLALSLGYSPFVYAIMRGHFKRAGWGRCTPSGMLVRDDGGPLGI